MTPAPSREPLQQRIYRALAEGCCQHSRHQGQPRVFLHAQPRCDSPREGVTVSPPTPKSPCGANADRTF
jgi:hypothetical protein